MRVLRIVGFLAPLDDLKAFGRLIAALRPWLVEELFGEDAPPATHYRLGNEDAGFYAEFLTPLQGSGVTRDG